MLKEVQGVGFSAGFAATKQLGGLDHIDLSQYDECLVLHNPFV